MGIGTTSPNMKFNVGATGGSSTSWSDKSGITNSTTDRSIFMSMYNGNAVLAVHNVALNAWHDLYINTVDGTTGMVVEGNGNVGIGTTSPAKKLHLYDAAAGDVALKIETSSGGDPTLYLTSQTANRSGIISFQDNGVNAGRIIYSHNGDNMDFYTVGIGASHLELSLNETAGAVFRTKVGIGTGDPYSILEVTAPATKTNLGTVSNQTITCSAGGGVGEYNQIGFGYTAGDYSPGVIGYVTTSGAVSTKGALIFATRNSTTASAPTERMRIDSSGFVTITNNPTTTDATLSLKKLSNAVAINDNIGYLNFLSNDASTSSSGGVGGIGVYAETAFNTSHTPSYMSFYTHATTTNDGTNIGNVTERMRIDSSGNVGIGTTAPGGKLHIKGDGDVANLIRLQHDGPGTNGYFDINVTDSEANLIANYSTTAIPIRFLTAATERMRIESGGNVRVNFNQSGSAGNVYFQDVANGASMFYIQPAQYVGTAPYNTNYINAANSSNIGFITGGSERMRITSGGDILFRGTDVPSASYLIGSGFKYDSKSRATLVQASDNNTLTDLQEYFNTNGAVGKIQTSGSATIFNTSSDYRLKEDLKDFNGLDMVSNINVYDFKWKIDGKRSYGVLAHELQEIIPDAAAGEKDAVNEDGTINPQGVDYSKIVPILVKSIQELKAEIDILKSK